MPHATIACSSWSQMLKPDGSMVLTSWHKRLHTRKLFGVMLWRRQNFDSSVKLNILDIYNTIIPSFRLFSCSEWATTGSNYPSWLFGWLVSGYHQQAASGTIYLKCSCHAEKFQHSFHFQSLSLFIEPKWLQMSSVMPALLLGIFGMFFFFSSSSLSSDLNLNRATSVKFFFFSHSYLFYFESSCSNEHNLPQVDSGCVLLSMWKLWISVFFICCYCFPAKTTHPLLLKNVPAKHLFDLLSLQMKPVPTALSGQSATPKVHSVFVQQSVWSPTSPYAVAMARPTPASASYTCGPAKNRWTCEWSARESAVSSASFLLTDVYESWREKKKHISRLNEQASGCNMFIIKKY